MTYLRNETNVTSSELRARIAELEAALRKWRFLFAEHDPDDVHPLSLVNVIAQTDEALRQLDA